MKKYEFEGEMPGCETEEEAFLDGFCEWIKEHVPQQQVIDPVRLREMLLAKKMLDGILRECGEKEEAKVSFEPMFSCASLRVEADSLEVRDPAAFMTAVLMADNFEVYALADGRVRLAFMFYNMMKEIC